MAKLNVRCMCTDPACPIHKPSNNCKAQANITLYRIDMTDRTGTPMCYECANDAMDSGVFGFHATR